MVCVIPSTTEDADTLWAFLVTHRSAGQLAKFKSTFEKGANVHFRPLMHPSPTYIYTDTSHAHIRTQENEAGNTDPFVIIDEKWAEKGAVWYVADFADDFDVECGFAESEEVLMQALVRTERLATSHVCWQEGNPPKGEELEALESSVVPLRTDTEQLEPLSADDEDDESWSGEDVDVVAEAGEYETTKSYAVRSNMSPMPREAVRLLPGIAQRENLVSDWTWPRRVSESLAPDNDDDDDDEINPTGRVRMSVQYDSGVPRFHYVWPKGSL